MKLFELFRAYPGGIARLSEDSGVAVRTLYTIAHAGHERVPIQALTKIASKFASRQVLGKRYGLDDLTRLWKQSKAAPTK